MEINRRKAIRKAAAWIMALMLAAMPLAGENIVLPDLGFGITAYALDRIGTCGVNVKWSFDSTTGTLTISGSGAMTNYQWGKSPFYHNQYTGTAQELSGGSADTLPDGLKYVYSLEENGKYSDFVSVHHARRRHYLL